MFHAHNYCYEGDESGISGGSKSEFLGAAQINLVDDLRA